MNFQVGSAKQPGPLAIDKKRTLGFQRHATLFGDQGHVGAVSRLGFSRFRGANYSFARLLPLRPHRVIPLSGVPGFSVLSRGGVTKRHLGGLRQSPFSGGLRLPPSAPLDRYRYWRLPEPAPGAPSALDDGRQTTWPARCFDAGMIYVSAGVGILWHGVFAPLVLRHGVLRHWRLDLGPLGNWFFRASAALGRLGGGFLGAIRRSGRWT